MNIIVLGAAGFIGTNLTMKLAENRQNKITVVDRSKSYFQDKIKYKYENVIVSEYQFQTDQEYDVLLKNQDVVYHLLSTTVPTTSNEHIYEELQANILVTTKILDACVKCNVKKVVFISSGGTVYGREAKCPLPEETATYPITSYGIQKITIEKLLYLYNYMYGLDYRVVRLANPYGPYQRPNGILGAVTTFTYKALTNDEIVVYGDGTVVRDYIYIDDAIKAIVNIERGDSSFKTFNVGCGYGTSIAELLEIIEDTLNVELNIKYVKARKVDVPVNYLDISRYEKCFGKLESVQLCEGIEKTADFMRKYLIKK